MLCANIAFVDTPCLLWLLRQLAVYLYISCPCNVTESGLVALNTSCAQNVANFVISDLKPNDLEAGSPYPLLLISSKLSQIAL